MNNDQNMNSMNNIPNQGMNQPMNGIPNQGMNQPMNGMPNQGMNMMSGQIPKKKLNPLFIAIPAIIIIIIIIIIVIVSGNSYKKPIQLYCQGSGDFDIETIKKAIPEEYIKELDSDEIEYFNNLKKQMQENNIEASLKCNITNDKIELTSEELEEINKNFKEKYNTTRTIDKAYKVKVEKETKITQSGKTNTEKESVYAIVGKIDGKWYYLEEEDID